MQAIDCQNSLRNRKLQAPLKNFQTSAVPVESEFNMAVSSSVRPKLTGRGSFIAIGTKTRKGKS
jgi:hypothetical protein